MTDTKFPLAILELARQSGFKVEEKAYFFKGDSDVYDKKLTDDWFKRCIKDFPKHEADEEYIRDVGPSQWLYYDYYDIQEWKVKWFEQFMEETRKPNKMVDDKHATCSNCGMPTPVTEPWMYQKGLCLACFNKEKEDSQ